MRCPRCGATTAAGTRFCERDGTRLVADDSFRPLDHVEQAPTPGLAGVSDRGRRHSQNEDALALAVECAEMPVHVLVVCDGVSQARDSQRAALVAAETTRDVLLELARVSNDPRSAMQRAIQAAHETVCALPEEPAQTSDPNKSQAPGCTLVAALVRDGQATIGWVGDSRAYRFGPEVAQLLTHDHSWFNAVVESGELTPAEAAASPNANAILQALGPLNADDDDGPIPPPVPDVITCDLAPDGVLLLCSDGLWKYAPEAESLADLLRAMPRLDGALELSRELVNYANSRGGSDNVTAAILLHNQEAQ